MKRTIIALALSALAMPATAQLTGTRINRNAGAASSVSKRDPQSAIRVANEFAKCLARREDKSVRRALDLPLASADQMRGLYKYIDQYDECLGTGNDEWSDLGTPPLLLAGGAAEYFANTTYKTTDFAPVVAMTEEALAKSPLAPRTALEDLGLCLVRRNVGHVRALLATKPTSESETAAARILAPDLGACVTQGQSVKMATPSLRAVAAYGVYRAGSKMGSAA